MRHTGAKTKKIRRHTWHINRRMKYIVASRRIVSRILGMPGYRSLGLLAVTTMTKNAKTSMNSEESEEHVTRQEQHVIAS